MDYKALLAEEYERKKSQRIELEEQIKTLPKGSVQAKTIRRLQYYYLQFREAGKVTTKYIPDKMLPEITNKIEKRKALEDKLDALRKEEEHLAMLLGRHVKYKPVKDIDNSAYTLFMSAVAHDYNRMEKSAFFEMYKPSSFRGLEKKYIKGFTDWINGSYEPRIHKGNDLILDPYTYYMYFDAGDRNILEEQLPSAIPAFLNQGLLITNVQVAVNGS